MTTRNQLEGLFSKGFDKPSDLLCCAFGLRSSETDAYFSLLSEAETVEEVASKIGRDRSTTQKILGDLFKKGLVTRDTKYFDRGGYYYVYKAISTAEVREAILKHLDEWYEETRRFLLESWSEQPEE
ncbi:transcriptional regulator [Candidatus Thorarchaeota archaeon]|nr:MAG: transcriptional regulator [Candidatus Thorarchaeota archaeon]